MKTNFYILYRLMIIDPQNCKNGQIGIERELMHGNLQKFFLCFINGKERKLVYYEMFMMQWCPGSY